MALSKSAIICPHLPSGFVKKPLVCICFLVFLLITPASHLAQAAMFSAEAVHLKNGKETAKERIQVSGSRVRLEKIKGKAAKITILRPDLDLVLQLDPRKKTFNELPYMPGASWTSLHRALKGALAMKGRETVSGQVCDWFEALGGIAGVWISRELDFPMKTIMGDETVELKNIRIAEVDDALFSPPSGYKLGFSVFAMQDGAPRFKPTEPAKVGAPPAPLSAQKDIKSRDDSPQPIASAVFSLPEIGKAMPAPRLRIRTVPSDGGEVSGPDQPLIVLFSQPVFPDHFHFSIKPDPGKWKVGWDKTGRTATLHHEVPFKKDQAYTLTVSMLGEPDVVVEFASQTIGPLVHLQRDLDRGHIDINQATRYRVLQVFNPGKVPEQYRVEKPGPSGTWNLLQAVREFDRLDDKTRRELTPYLLPPHNPDSIFYRRFFKSGHQSSKKKGFNLVSRAWADNDNVVKAVHKTGTGYEVIVWGDRDMAKTVYKARDLIKQYRMYERFERLMGRKTLDYGDHSLNIYIFSHLREMEETVDGETEFFEPAGICWPDKYQYGQTPSDQRASTIMISAGQCNTDRELGSALAHEMFHAFQFAFTLRAQKWLVEGSAVWAENFINPAWNTEQEYLDDAFNFKMKSLKALTDQSSDINAYAMYLFPLYMTKVSPGYDDIIRRIWEGCEGGTDSVQATRSALGDFDANWKTYALATMDEMPEEGRFPDVDNKHGDGPLVLEYRHKQNEFEIDKEGYGGAAFGLTHLGAAYVKAVNKNKGPDAPAISFDLRRFHGNNKITVQAIIKYRDGRREYEDWSDMPERIFCLSHEKQNFEELYIVVACSEDKKRKEIAEVIDVVPAFDNDCYKGSLTATWRVQGNKSMQRKMGWHSEDSETSTSSWSRSATVRMEIKPFRQDMPPQLSSALKQMETMFPQVKKEHIEKGRRAAKSAVRAPVTSEDPNTGCTVHKYRVTSCRIVSASENKRLKSKKIENDGMGLTGRCTTSYTENAYPTGLNDNTREWLDKGDLEVNVFIDPESERIKWVNFSTVGVDLEMNRNSRRPCSKRYQNKETGAYYYKDEDHSWNDSKESDILLTFDSDSKDRKGQPLDPVWKTRHGGSASASGKGRKERPLDHKWNEATDKGEIRGKEVVTFTWRLNLEAVDDKKK